MNPKTRKILMWVCIVLLALQFVAAAAGKLTGAAEENFIRWGYSGTFMYIIGALEIICAIGLFFPAFRKRAALGIIVIMLGAAYTHLTHDEGIRLIHNAILVLMAVGVIALSKE
jgi:putative oxidoreductase